ncbi:MAG: alkaline phosphatase [Paludibacteraceae bacterium]|nr:alkaline phosphatase [Paludibacteraceae bacterium]
MKRLLLSAWLLCLAVAIMAQAKYVFFFIGDGMGPNQVLTAEMYQAAVKGQNGRVPLCMSQFPYSGQAATFSASDGITDSAAAGTCLASGKKTNNGMIGQTPDGEPAISVASMLHDEGWAVGIMSSVPVDHATPASQYAHAEKRSNYYLIGTHLTESNFDFFGGGGFQRPNDKHNPSAPNLYDLVRQAGYTLVGSYADAKKHLQADKLLLVPQTDIDHPNRGAEALPYAIDQQEGDLNLAQIVDIAIQHLSQHDRFFMMAEGGKIDYAGHGNDGATNIHEVIDFDQAIQVAYRFYEQHPDETLIVVTADHETGGMALGKEDSFELQLLQYQTCSSDVLSQRLTRLHEANGAKLTWAQVKNLLSELTGLYAAVELDKEEDANLQEAFEQMMRKQSSVKTLYEDINLLAARAKAILSDKAGVGWVGENHTASAVPVFAVGVGAERFTGWMDNSDIAPRIYQATR